MIYTLIASQKEAEDICQTLLQEKLIACANCLSPSTSLYVWEDTLHKDHEYPVIIKTSLDRKNAAMARIGELHSYDQPAIITWNADSTPDFLNWVKA